MLEIPPNVGPGETAVLKLPQISLKDTAEAYLKLKFPAEVWNESISGWTRTCDRAGSSESKIGRQKIYLEDWLHEKAAPALETQYSHVENAAKVSAKDVFSARITSFHGP